MFSIVNVWFAEVHDFAAYLYDAICIMAKMSSLNASTSGTNLTSLAENMEFTGSSAICYFALIFSQLGCLVIETSLLRLLHSRIGNIAYIYTMKCNKICGPQSKPRCFLLF